MSKLQLLNGGCYRDLRSHRDNSTQRENRESNEVKSGGLLPGSKTLKSKRKQTKKGESSHTSAGGRTDTMLPCLTSSSQTLTAAAAEISEAIERAVAELHEEISGSKEENIRLRRLLDLVFNPEIKLHRAVNPDCSAAQSENRESDE
ncbi:unnamed protein product, partial [Coregonus sp. 'balchen']